MTHKHQDVEIRRSFQDRNYQIDIITIVDGVRYCYDHCIAKFANYHDANNYAADVAARLGAQVKCVDF